MKNIFPLAALLLPLAMLASCQSSPSQGAAGLESPGTVNITPAITKQLPTGILEISVVSSKVVRATPTQVALPPSWRQMSWLTKPGAASAAGYRITYQAMVVWKPTTAAKRYFGMLRNRDSLSVFHSLDSLQAATYKDYQVSPLVANKPFPITGTLYAYLGTDKQKNPVLIVYPYPEMEHYAPAISMAAAAPPLELPIHE